MPIIYDMDLKFVKSSYGSKTSTFLVHADDKMYTIKFDPAANSLVKIAESENQSAVTLAAKLR